MPILAEAFEVEKNPEGVEPPKHKVSASRKSAVFSYAVPTKEYGLIKGEVQASRDALQYRHRIGLGGVLLNNAALFRAGYSYRGWDFSLYYGYNFTLREQSFGMGLGYSFSF